MPTNAVDTLPRQSELTDEALVEGVLAGESECFAVLMRRYNQRVYRIARGILGSDAEAEDTSQDAFFTAYQKLDQLATPAAFAGWVARIAANAALRRLRRERTLQGLIDRGEITVSDDHPQDSPEDSARTRELRSLLEGAIGRLPARYRSVLVMRDVEAMSTAETAHALEVDPVTVRVRLHRARRLMREQLSETIDVAAAAPFAFDGERCDRMVAAVFGRILELEPATGASTTPLRARRPGRG